MLNLNMSYALKSHVQSIQKLLAFQLCTVPTALPSMLDKLKWILHRERCRDQGVVVVDM